MRTPAHIEKQLFVIHLVSIEQNAGLQVAALLFAASFFVISIACDYRYLYFLDLAAMTGVLAWLCGRPRGPGSKAPGSPS